MQPRDVAHKIWHSGVDRVRAERLIEESVNLEANADACHRIRLGETTFDLNSIRRICVVGAGKAAGYLALALAKVLEPIAEDKQVHGWINVPANCVVAQPWIRLHAARPAGVNEPRPEGVEGTAKILEMVSNLHLEDLCICLLTGGGSALLPAPRPGITLEDKLTVTKLMSRRGASIQELNQVRIALSAVKGGGLAKACKAKRMITLIVSDILGDPVHLIASGPTVFPPEFDEAAVSVLERFADRDELSAAIWDRLQCSREANSAAIKPSTHDLHVLGNNQTAVRAAIQSAREFGLQVFEIPPEAPDTTAEEVAGQLVRRINALATTDSADLPVCIIWGGEPVVHLSDKPGVGGRNQQLALAVLNAWSQFDPAIANRLCVLSGGTDGEDGPTDAAGAFVDASVVQRALEQKLDIRDALSRNDAYPVFENVNGLIKTGPTHTNVCDLRVAVLLGEFSG